MPEVKTKKATTRKKCCLHCGLWDSCIENVSDMKIAIVCVAYNRVDSLQRLFTSLEQTYYPEAATLSCILSHRRIITTGIYKRLTLWT